ncbi:MAG TPA: hypothetical protein VEX62_00985 [Candidatus Limnocylindrales bacterium]|nr:hypothetical protein [Candidatus Limnocylindrales bacterium]
MGAEDVTQNRTLKRQVRARMSKTGERYTSARHQVLAKAPTVEPPAAEPVAPTLVADEPLHGPTSRSWSEWVRLLDESGAAEKPHTEIAHWLSAEHGVPGWWTQDITVRYEKHIGRRVTLQRGKTFSATGSRTVGVPVASALAAWLDDDIRASWLRDVTLRLRSARTASSVRYKTARFDVNDGEGRVVVSFDPKGDAKTSIAIEHEKLPDAQSAARWKTSWRSHLGALKELLEAIA